MRTLSFSILLGLLAAVTGATADGQNISYFGSDLLNRRFTFNSKHLALYTLYPQPIETPGQIYAASGIFSSTTAPVYIGVWRAVDESSGTTKKFRLLHQWEVSAMETGNCVYSQLLSPCYGVEVGDYIGVYSRETPWAVSSYDQSQSYSTYVYKGGNELRQTGQGPSKDDERTFDAVTVTSRVRISLSVDTTGTDHCRDDDMVACLTDQLPHCPPSAGRLDILQCFYVDAPITTSPPPSASTTEATRAAPVRTTTPRIITTEALLSNAKLQIEGYSEPLQQGDSVTLVCASSPDLEGVEYEWVFMPEGTEYSVPMGTDKELLLPSVGKKSAGEYTCRTSIASLELEDKVTVEVRTDGADDAQDERQRQELGTTNTIIIAVVVVVVAVALVGVVGVCARIRRRNMKENEIAALDDTGNTGRVGEMSVEDIESE